MKGTLALIPAIAISSCVSVLVLCRWPALASAATSQIETTKSQKQQEVKATTIPQVAKTDAPPSDRQELPAPEVPEAFTTATPARRMTSKTPEAPTPFLIGNYGYTYYRLDADPSEEFLLRRKRAELAPSQFQKDSAALQNDDSIDRTSLINPTIQPIGPNFPLILNRPPANRGAPVRFFAAQFKLPQGSIDLKDARAYDTFQRKAEEASRVVEWNNVSLVARGFLNQTQYDLNDWVIVGANCPSCAELHWVAYGYDDNNSRFEVFSNSRSGRRGHSQVRGWQSRPSSRRLRQFPGVLPARSG